MKAYYDSFGCGAIWYDHNGVGCMRAGGSGGPYRIRQVRPDEFDIQRRTSFFGIKGWAPAWYRAWLPSPSGYGRYWQTPSIRTLEGAREWLARIEEGDRLRFFKPKVVA